MTFPSGRRSKKNGEDASILGGLAFFHGYPVTVIGHQKGRDLEEKFEVPFRYAESGRV